MKTIKDKKVLITGAAAGIGLCLALELARRGAHVWLVDRDADALAAAAKQVRELGVQAGESLCDVSDPEQIRQAVDQVLGQWGHVDILVNNAGVLVYGSIKRVTAEQWQRSLAVNLHAPIQFIQALLPTLLDRPEAHILNVASMHGLAAIRNIAPYQTTKFALVGLTESLRADLRRTGVGATALCPGYVQTKLMTSADNANPRRALATPKRWMCVSAERVARAGVRGIRKNRGLVVIGWPAHVLTLTYRLSPRLYDLMRRLL